MPHHLANAGQWSADAQPRLRHRVNLLRGVDADLLQERLDEIGEDFLPAGNAGLLQRPADPLLDAIDQSRNDPHDEVIVPAHAGRKRMGDVKHLEDRPDALLAVRLHGADSAKVELV